MKKQFLIVSGAAIMFVMIASGFTGVNTGNESVYSSNYVRHQVTIHLPSDLNLCNTYVIAILNAKGEMVSPSRVLVEGVSTYSIFEPGPGTRLGTRVAVLMKAGFETFVCEQEITSVATGRQGTFEPGKTYFYDLYPKLYGNSPK